MAKPIWSGRCTAIIGPGFWEEATGPLPASLFQTRLRFSQTALIILRKTSPDPIYFRLTLSGMAKWIGSRSWPVCKNHQGCFRPTLPNRSGPDLNRIRCADWEKNTAVTSKVPHKDAPYTDPARDQQRQRQSQERRQQNQKQRPGRLDVCPPAPHDQRCSRAHAVPRDTATVLSENSLGSPP